MGGVSIFGNYCKKFLRGGAEKKFPQRKNQLLPYIKKPYIKNKTRIISTTKKSTFIIYKKQNQNNFHNEKINFYHI